ncbi:hypothetical protein [Blastococcus sp. SYSU D00820]
MSTGDPWADPSTPTEQGAPYAGPPAWGTTPAPPGPPGAPYGYPPQPYGYPPQPYGYPPAYGYPVAYVPLAPAGPRRPGQVITAAVLAFVQAGVVAFATAYVFLFASLFGLAADGFGDDEAGSLATEANVIAIVQILSVIALVTGGILALNRNTRATWTTLLAALAVQIALSLYWGIRVASVLGDVPGPDDAVGVFVFGAICFAAAPAVGIGLLCARVSRDWFAPAPPPAG